jgi:uncharacterized protein with PIN domain
MAEARPLGNHNVALRPPRSGMLPCASEKWDGQGILGNMEERFIADAMLGRLARWLRIMGYDVEYFPLIDDDELMERSERSGRLVLTRDTLLAKRKRLRGNCFFVAGDHFRDQLRQVVRAYALDPSARFLTRCLECNSPLAEMERGNAEALVPSYVFATQGLFRQCPSCGKIYWGGTHRERMRSELMEIIKD